MFILLNNVSAQVYIPLYNEKTIEIEQEIIEQNTNLSTFIKPFDYKIRRELIQYTDTTVKKKKYPWLIRKMFHENLLHVDSVQYSIIGNPVFNFSYGKISDNSLPYYHNIRGAYIGGNIGQKIFFESFVEESQSRWPLYVSDFIHSSHVVPGKGQARRFGKGGFDYALSQGSIAFPINQLIDIYLGTGKHFAGDGYRSVLLSDITNNYPYLHIRFRSKYWNISEIFAVTMSDTIPLTSYGLRVKRLAHFAIISYIPHRNIEMSLFEGYIFHYPNRKKDYYLNPLYFNPIPLTSITFSDTGVSSLIGINLRINFLKKGVLYHQVGMSNIHYCSPRLQNMGYQIGVKFYNLFAIRNLFLRAEWNYGGKRYSFSTDSLLNYSHYNQPLGHFLGNNFKELIVQMQYRYNRFILNAQMNRLEYGYKNMLPLPFKNQFTEIIAYNTPFIGAGPYAFVKYYSFSFGYYLNSSASHVFEIGITDRKAHHASMIIHSNIFYISLKTNLHNFYIDF